MGRVLQPKFFNRDALVVARDLVGAVLRTSIGGAPTAGRIVETEAYLGPDDPASHSFGGRRTRRNESMYGPPGTAYVYFIYGMHWCFNAVTGPADFPAAVLIRALEPLEGSAIMQQRRNQTTTTLLCSGPARLCQAMAIDGKLDGILMPHGLVSFAEGELPPSVASGPRIGITRGVDKPLRFWEADSPFVSVNRASTKRKGRTG